MNKFLKYLGMFCLLSIAASLAFCSMGVYQGFNTASRIFAGADNYTCRQFNYDLEHPETDKFAPLLIATVAYGANGGEKIDKEREDEVVNSGMHAAVQKVYALCKGQPAERVLNLFTAEITGVTTVSNTTRVISATAPVSSTLKTDH